MSAPLRAGEAPLQIDGGADCSPHSCSRCSAPPPYRTPMPRPSRWNPTRMRPFSSTARLLENGRIEVELRAWIHERDRHKLLDAGLARYLGIELSTMSSAE